MVGLLSQNLKWKVIFGGKLTRLPCRFFCRCEGERDVGTKTKSFEVNVSKVKVSNLSSQDDIEK